MRAFAVLLAISGPALQSQPVAYTAWHTFNIPGGTPYLETSTTLVGKSLVMKKTGGKFQQSVHVSFVIYKDTGIVKASKYNLNGPAFTDSLKAPSLIDNQRCYLPNGRYVAMLKISDNYNPGSQPLVIEETIDVNYLPNALSTSDIQLLENYSKASTPGPLTKSGFDLVPYTINYFPESTSTLAFYLECYNADKALGNGQALVYNYFIENAENGHVLSNYGAFKKQNAGPVNPLLAKMDISKLGTGQYNLVVTVKDQNNIQLSTKKVFFDRVNRNVDVVALQKNAEMVDLAEYFGNCNNSDTLKMFVECLWPISDGKDKEYVINQAINKDPVLMKRYIVDFWRRRAADTANPVKLWAAYYQQVQKAMVLFKCGKMPGYYTDRGRVFLQYGAPNQRSQQTNEPNTYPYEIWQYYRITDGVNGQFYTNRRFVFVSRNLGDDCYTLIHSDMRGEINNPRWQFDVARGTNNGIANPDNTVPAGTQFNQFNEIYTNPR